MPAFAPIALDARAEWQGGVTLTLLNGEVGEVNRWSKLAVRVVGKTAKHHFMIDVDQQLFGACINHQNNPTR